jgi:catechol-2,3-dioxygenase
VADLAPPIIRIGHVAFRTSKLEEMADHYTTVMGLWECGRGDDGAVYLTCGGSGADVELIPGDDPGLDHVAFDLAPGTDIEATAGALGELGVETFGWERQDPAAVASIGLRDVEGNVLQLSTVEDTLQDFVETTGVKPRKLGHVTTRVKDGGAVRRFYEEKLGFRFSDSNGEGIIFLRCNADHHAVNFIEASNPGQVHHVAFELEDDFGHVQRAAEVLANRGIRLVWGPGRHGPGHSIFTYHEDPDLHYVELFTQLDRMSHERQGYWDPRPWHDRRPAHPREWNKGDRRLSGMTPPRPPDFLD